MNVPLFRRIRQNFPKCHLTVLCSEASSGVLKFQPDIDETLIFPESPAARFALWRRLARAGFDAVVVSNPDKAAHFWAFAGGARVRAGFRRKWGFFLNRGIADTKARLIRHEIDFNLELADSFCPAPWDRTIDLGLDRDAGFVPRVAQKFDLPARFAAFHVRTSNPKKQWPLAKFAAVMREVIQGARLPVVLVGSGDREEILKGLKLEPSPDFRELIGRTSLIELAAILKQAALTVSLDSGPYHVAWMQKRPVVGLFPSEDPGSNPVRWGVYPGFVKCRQIHKRSDEITEREVIEGIRECL